MGTWDTGPFDNDGALDWIGDALENGIGPAIDTKLDEMEQEVKQGLEDENFFDSYVAEDVMAMAETCAIILGKAPPVYFEDAEMAAQLKADPYQPNVADLQRIIALLDQCLGPHSAIVMDETWDSLESRDTWRNNALATRAYLLEHLAKL
jgi:hypothetical protein